MAETDSQFTSSGRDKDLLTQQIKNSFLPIKALLEDTEITDIYVYGPQDVSYIRRGEARQRSPLGWNSERDLRIAISQLGRYLKRKIDEKNPILDSRLPDGSRVNVIISPCYARGVCMTIRRFPKIRIGEADLLRLGTLERRGMDILKAVIRSGRNVLISGGTGTGKTTLLNVLASFIDESDSVVSIEDAMEIRLVNRFWAALEKKEAMSSEDSEVSIRVLLKNALRMNPKWIIVGEVRGDEVIDLVRGFNTGHSGISTIHANSCRDALFALEVLLMNYTNQRIEAIRLMLARVIHVVVQLRHFPDHGRRVTEIATVNGIDYASGLPEIAMEQIYAFVPGKAGSGDGAGPSPIPRD